MTRAKQTLETESHRVYGGSNHCQPDTPDTLHTMPARHPTPALLGPIDYCQRVGRVRLCHFPERDKGG